MISAVSASTTAEVATQVTRDTAAGIRRETASTTATATGKKTTTLSTALPHENQEKDGPNGDDRRGRVVIGDLPGLQPPCHPAERDGTGGDAVDSQVQRTVDVRFGAEYTPTREGAFSVQFKSRDHVSSLYGSSMPFAMFFSGGQAVHYSSDFAARGYYGASHGCVNVRDYDAIAWLFDQVDVGDPVVVYRS